MTNTKAQPLGYAFFCLCNFAIGFRICIKRNNKLQNYLFKTD